jgi:hypothetical protein
LGVKQGFGSKFKPPGGGVVGEEGSLGEDWFVSFSISFVSIWRCLVSS